MRVRIQHTTRLDYTADVVEGVTDGRLGPLSDGHQRWERFSLRVDPPAAVGALAGWEAAGVVEDGRGGVLVRDDLARGLGLGAAAVASRHDH